MRKKKLVSHCLVVPFRLVWWCSRRFVVARVPTCEQLLAAVVMVLLWSCEWPLSSSGCRFVDIDPNL
jgi:hypothetical protein